MTVSDGAYLGRALRLAAKGRYRVTPNPMVGAIVVRDGRVVGDGFHRQVGGAHAEVEALAAAGDAARGATVYVTLEPCAHHGRTPPCVDALLGAGVSRVVACHRDPDPRMAGRSFDALRAAGVDVAVGSGLRRAVCLNWRYLTGLAHRRPGVTLKWAMSLDGKIATVTGDSQWISSPSGRRWSLGLREEHDAILVGSGTVLADDPRLDRRLGKADGPIVRAVLDRRLRTPAAAAMLALPGPVIVFTEAADGEAARRLSAAGADVVRLASVTPAAVLAELWAREVRSVLVEGGGTVAASFLASRLFDRVAVDCAPMLIGGATAPGPLGGVGAATLGEALRLEETFVGRRGTDFIVSGFRAGCLQDLYESVGG